MKKIFRLITVLFVLCFSIKALSHATNSSGNIGTRIAKAKFAIGATIAGNASVCQNQTGVVVTFTGSGGTAPYTFTYKINGGTNQTVTTTGSANTATVSVSTLVAGPFKYDLVSVAEGSNPAVAVTGQSATVTVDASPTVDFTFGDNQCSGTNVTFTSNVSGGKTPYAYSWDFGDGTNSTQQNPVHAFTSLGCATGTFTVKLTVTAGGCAVTKSKTITIKQKPNIDFGDKDNPFDAFSNCANASVNPTYNINVVNNSTSACITSYTIDWGDGNTQNNAVFPASHQYTAIGAYNMVITALGTNGCSNSKTYVIKNVSNPSGGITSPGSTQNLCAPTANLQFAISNWGDNSPDTKYEVDYGDGTPIVSLDQSQLKNSTYYNASNPSASTNYPIPHSYNSSSCPSPNGQFIATLKVTNACSSTTGTIANITVLTKPNANFTAPANACVNNSITFNNTTTLGYGQNCSPGAIYTWDFGDGTPVVTTGITSPQNMSHTYTATGTYTVKLTSQNFCGTSSKTQEICIEQSSVSPQFTLSALQGCVPFAVTTQNTTVTSNLCSTATYKWEVTYTNSNCGTVSGYTFSNGTNDTSASPSFNFTEPGTYAIKLTVFTACGNQVTTQTITVKKVPTVSINPIADICGAGGVTPTAISCPDINAEPSLIYAWNFTGGTPSASTSANPGTINYSATGNYTASLTVSNTCGASTAATQSFAVKPVPALTNTGLSETVCSGIPTTAVNLTADKAGTTFSWTATATNGISGYTPSGTNLIPTQTLTISGSSPGTVTYAITPSLNGCNGTTVNYVITVSPAPIISTQPVSSTVCVGGSPQAMNVAVSNSSVTPGYQWFSNSSASYTGGTPISNATTATFNPPATVTGTVFYYCEISLSSGGCTTIKSNIASVTVASPPTINTQPTASQGLCVGVTIPSALSVSYQNGAGTVSYQWYSNVSNTNTGGTAISNAIQSSYTPPVYTAAGTYYYYMTISSSDSSCGSVTSNVAEVIVYDDPVIGTQPLASQTLCQGATSNALKVVVSGGFGTSYKYQWYSNAANNTTTGSAIAGEDKDSYNPPTTVAGTVYYYCIVTQTGAGCGVVSEIAKVTVNIAPTISNHPAPATYCIGNIAQALSFTVSNGVGTPTYQWYSNNLNDNTAGTAINLATSATYLPPTNVVGATYYYCKVTFSSLAQGCDAAATNATLISVNQKPVIASENKTICSASTLTVAPDSSGGNIVPSGTLFTWQAPTISPAGSVTGASAQNTPQTNISQTLVNVTSSPATVTYVVTPTAGICQGNSFNVTVTVNPAINSNVSINNSTCYGKNDGSISTTISGGIPFSSGSPYKVSWTGPNGFTSAASAISNLIPGNYDLTITDQGGCPFSKTYIVTEPGELKIVLKTKNDLSCYGSNDGAVDIDATGGTGNYVYTWTKGGNVVSNTQDISNLSPGDYTLTLTDANNCGPQTAMFTIVEPSELIVGLSNQTNVKCYGDATGVINVNVAGGTPAATGYDFAWTGPNGFTSNNQNLINIYAGTYDLTVKDKNGCTKKLSVTITQSPAINIAYTTTPIVCYGDNNATISVTISGGVPTYQYEWSNMATTLTQTDLSAGDYTITVTDNEGCKKDQTINIPEAPLFKTDPVVKEISCHGMKDASIKLNFVGGIAPIKMQWSDGSTAGTTRNNLGPGTYSVVITDSKPCTISKAFTIIDPQPLVISGNTSNALDCDNANSGAINLMVSGGTPPFDYTWSNASDSEDLTNIPAGNYMVTVMDSHGCSKADQYSIIRPEPIVISVDTKTDFNCETHSVKQNFVAKVSGGLAPYQLSWSSGEISGANNEIMHTETNGMALITATDSYGCSKTYPLKVDIPELGYASFKTTSYGLVNYGFYSINDPIQFTSEPTGDYKSIVWDFGDGTFSAEANPVHTYKLAKDYLVTQKVTYPFGCEYTEKITLSVENGYVLVVPNAFTPNDDTVNDRFRPVVKALKNIRLDVYDTWGSLIFSETGNVINGWDGKIKGRNAENGNYYCKVSAETFYGEVVKVDHPFVIIK